MERVFNAYKNRKKKTLITLAPGTGNKDLAYFYFEVLQEDVAEFLERVVPIIMNEENWTLPETQAAAIESG
jgi:hypothetical protein